VRTAGLLAVCALGFVAACSRSELHIPSEKSPPISLECVVDADCIVAEDLCLIASCHAGACVIIDQVSCDDGDPCTSDRCVPATGQCEHEPLTYDLDGDGHRAPLPGFAPGEPGACGDDCDDTNPNAYPGAIEVCDGADNDCNGIVDDGMAYAPAADDFEAIEVSGPHASPASPGGLAFGFGNYVASYTARDADKDGVFLRSIGDDGTLGEPSKVNNFPADASGARLVFTGDRFGVVWQDRREGDYEIYFNTLDASGQKLGPDLNLSQSFGFSLNPANSSSSGKTRPPSALASGCRGSGSASTPRPSVKPSSSASPSVATVNRRKSRRAARASAWWPRRRRAKRAASPSKPSTSNYGR